MGAGRRPKMLGSETKRNVSFMAQQAARAQAYFMPVLRTTIFTQCYKGGEVMPAHAGEER